MPVETSKCRDRILQYISGCGIDVGCGDEKVVDSTFGVDVKRLDTNNYNHDAHGLPFENLDYVYSSHCLEHLEQPFEALVNWITCLKSGGYLILYLPHKDYYKEPNPEHLHELAPEIITNWIKKISKTLKTDVEIISNNTYSEEYSFEIVALKH